MAEFIPLDQVEWRSVNYLTNGDSYDYHLVLPRPLADWDVYDYWERERVYSMRERLRPGMVLFDVGAEQGWCNLVYASMVGPENMVLIEPTKEFWPNIRATWDKNYSVPPKACYDGLLSDTTDDPCAQFVNFSKWPACSAGPLIDRNKYQYIHEHSDDVQQMRLDELVALSGVVPDALTLDVEGAELLVLQGAVDTLEQHRPLVWVSIHPDLGARDYGVTPDQVRAFMDDLGYVGTHLADDHESHWVYQPK